MAPNSRNVLICYDVIEHHDDDPPEPFGQYLHSVTLPRIAVGSVIMLRWLDGREAYRVRVMHICNGVLDVAAIKAPAPVPAQGNS